MDPGQCKITVWLCQEEKLVSGLSKRTSCADVVRALVLDQERSERLRGDQGSSERLRGDQGSSERLRGDQGSSERLRGDQGSSERLRGDLERRERLGGDQESSERLRGEQERSERLPRSDQEDEEEEEEEEEEEDGDEEEEARVTSLLSGSLDSYCIVEKWRGFERTLPNKTKLLRLWAAWGEERDNVTFVLVRSEASLANSGARSAQARVVLSRETPCGPHRAHGRARLTLASLPRDKQRRIVRKAFRKLAKMNRKRRGGDRERDRDRERGGGGKEEEEAVGRKMETLVHLVLSQDHTLRQQLQRLRELDREIDRYQAKVHLDRMERHGVNYVQDTYLVDGVGEEGVGQMEEEVEERERPDPDPNPSPCPAPGAQAVKRNWEQVRRLQEQLYLQEEMMERVRLEIQEELNRRWMKRRREGPGLNPDWDSPQPGTQGGLPETQVSVSLERLRTQLDTSLYIGLRLHTDSEKIRGQLSDCQGLWEDKERELETLAAMATELRGSLTILESPRGEEGEGGEQAAAGGWEEDLTLSKTCLNNNRDEDSDTGLSSMNSQDSDNVPVCESLV